MTTTIKKTRLTTKKTPAKVSNAKARSAVKKPLRIREELLPNSARYITIDDVEYVALPVAEFGDWYEDALDGAIADYAADDPASLIPAEVVHASIIKSRKTRKV